MAKRKLIKGGNLGGATPYVGSHWIMIAMFIFGLLVGGGALWFVLRERHVSQTTTSQPPTVVVVPTTSSGGAATNSSLPVYPNRDPEYPLRALSATAEYQQVGILKSTDGSEPIALPLFGRRMPNRPDRWEYYTATDKQNMLRVPVVFENRDCLEEVGCNEVYKGDKIEVPVYDKTFEVQLYKYRQ